MEESSENIEHLLYEWYCIGSGDHEDSYDMVPTHGRDCIAGSKVYKFNVVLQVTIHRVIWPGDQGRKQTMGDLERSTRGFKFNEIGQLFSNLPLIGIS